MSEDFSIEVLGMDALQAKLEELGGNEAKTIVRDGLKEGGEALRGAMQVQGGANKAELGKALSDQRNWSKSVKMGDELSGTVRVGPKGSLVDIHVARGGGMQPKGRIYRRSLKYIVKMMEFGGHDARALNVGQTMPMSRGFSLYKDAILERIISVIKERLHL